MKVVVQRSKYSKVSVNNKLVNEIDKGLVLLIGFTQGDNQETITKMAETASLRLVAFRPFHGKIDGQRTEHEHQPRDAFYLFVKVQENKSVKEVGR